MSAHSAVVADWEDRVRAMLAGSPRGELAGWGLRLLGEGQENVAVLVGEEFVVRLPKGADGAAGLVREGRLLAELAPGLRVAVPRYEFTAPNPMGPGECCVYAVVPGEVLAVHEWRRRGLLEKRETVRTVAEFFEGVQAFSAGRAQQLGIEVRDMRGDFSRDLELVRAQVIPRVPAEAGEKLVGLWEKYLTDAANFEYRPTLMHADVSLDHLLVTGDRITGVIDFGDVQIGDPDFDLSYLWAEAGVEFVRRVQNCRGLALGERLVAKLDFWAIADSAVDILHAVEHELPEFRDLSVERLCVAIERFGGHSIGSV